MRYAVVIVCIFMFSIFQLFHIIELADSHPNIPPGTERANKYNNLVSNIILMPTSLGLRKTDLLAAQLVITNLNTNWLANETAIKAGEKVLIDTALDTLFTTIGAFATSGTSVLAKIAVTGPDFIKAAKAYKEAAKIQSRRLNRSVYLNAFVAALEGYDAAMAFHKSEHDEYTDFYFQYLQMEVDHDGGLYTDANGSAFSVEQLYESRNGLSVTLNSDGSRVFDEWQDGLSVKRNGYYHLITNYYGNRLGVTNHDIKPHFHWDQVTNADLPVNLGCYGSSTCEVLFLTYYEAMYSHVEICGTAVHVSIAAFNVAKQIKNQIENLEPGDEGFDSSLESTYPIAYKWLKKGAEIRDVFRSIEVDILRVRTVDEGCGRSYYNCDDSSNDLHTNRNCIGNSIEGDSDDGSASTDGSSDCASCTSTSECSTCSSDGDESASTDCASCTNTSECSACDTTETSTSATPTEPGLYPPSDDDSTITIDDELMVDSYPGEEDISVILVMPSDKGYSQIYLYLADPNDTGYGNQLGDTLRPSSSSLVTEVSLEIDIPNDVSGVCTITAYIYPHPSASDQTCYEYSFKIYIS